ncbi:hypothetical protein RFI_38248 [Reticulomyxa filosa]|uniref:Uncharacterized protein n=1 Tax=Reticulomyxa filosa TaxID=46433 RepID=X6LCF7_RETFI|nr:hypothetical protein RFI_38248 [Reticulomyxa filosa]|eukprot:ETN99233.1 hypothetical protein RFI_38248 [Reticulomyxa filosa]
MESNNLWSTHMKTEVSEWLSEKGIELKVEEEKEKKEINEQQNKVKKDIDDANEREDQTREKDIIVMNICIYFSLLHSLSKKNKK